MNRYIYDPETEAPTMKKTKRNTKIFLRYREDVTHLTMEVDLCHNPFKNITSVTILAILRDYKM